MDVSKNMVTPKWMVYNDYPIKMDDLGVPLFLETSIYIYIYTIKDIKVERKSYKVLQICFKSRARQQTFPTKDWEIPEPQKKHLLLSVVLVV